MNVLELLLDRVREEMAKVTNALAGGSCKDFMEYKRLVGMLEGLQYVEQQIVDLNRRLDES